MGDCSGSTKEYSFRLGANKDSNELHLFECVIDALSFATLLKMKGHNWQEYNLISLSGVYQPKEQIEESTVPIALANYLKENPNINTVKLHLDNDYTGRMATNAQPQPAKSFDHSPKALVKAMFTALAPIPFSTFAGEPTQNVGRSFIKSYCGVLLEGAVIILACIIFSLYASSPPQVDTGASAVTMVWKYVGELVFNMLVLVGTVKMSDRIIHEMMGM